MNGSGSATGAITFVNALFTGIGSAAGIELPVTATVELVPGDGPTRIEPDAASDSPVVRATALAALARWSVPSVAGVRIRVESGVPVSRGLKSSSAVGDAVVRALADALSIAVPPIEVARLTATVARAEGLSATGAFDDALAAAAPGIHVTDNSSMTLIRTDPVVRPVSVVVAVPPTPHPPSTEYLASFRAAGSEAGPAVSAARAGDPYRAMAENTRLVERLLGLDYRRLHEHLRAAGGLASGVSGMGPAVAVLCPPKATREVQSALEDDVGPTFVTRLVVADQTPAEVRS